MALIEIDGLPSYKMVMIFHGDVSHNQMVYHDYHILEHIRTRTYQ